MKRRLSAAVKEAAHHLGNTPAVCRSSYISPSIFHSFEKGQVVKSYFETVDELVAHDGHALHRSERALMTLISEASP